LNTIAGDQYGDQASCQE